MFHGGRNDKHGAVFLHDNIISPIPLLALKPKHISLEYTHFHNHNSFNYTDHRTQMLLYTWHSRPFKFCLQRS